MSSDSKSESVDGVERNNRASSDRWAGDVPPELPRSIDGDCPAVSKAAGWEWLIIALICLFCVGYWIPHYQRYYHPNPDYYSFERTAEEIWSGRIPSDYWRMPLYPAIFGALAQVLPGENPYYDAAHLINIFFSIGALLLLFLFLRGLIGRAAIVTLGFFAFSMVFHDLTQKPLLEPFMFCTIMLTLLLFRRGSRWQYFAAFLASLTRYEASSLILILFLLNSFDLRARLFGPKSGDGEHNFIKLEWDNWRALKHLAFSALASIGIIAWIIGSMTSKNPHVEVMSEWGWPTNPEVVIVAVTEPFYIWAEKARDGGYMAVAVGLFIALPCLIGLWLSMKKFARVSLAIIMYFAITVVILVLFGVLHRRYLMPVFWIPAMYFTVGWSWILSRLDRKLFGEKQHGKALTAISIAVALVSCAALWSSFAKAGRADGTAFRPLYIEVEGTRMLTPDTADLSVNEVYPIFWFAMTAAFFAFGYIWGKEKGGRAVIVGFLLAAFMGYYGASEIRRHTDILWRRYYRYYDFHVAGQYLEKQLKPGERATLLSTSVVLATTKLPPDSVFRFSKLNASNLDELPAALEEQDIDYVVYTWRQFHIKEESPEKYRIQAKRNYDLMYDFMLSVDQLEDFELVKVLDFPEKKIGDAPRVYRFKRQ